ncbi:MAG: hypothetical protein A2X49_07955 [Lentisphaerae bacterium GWF2_52_8]|nr:MAG: hypothetical protein A2X49_07955 [Lentisphaerae bacterium GWF2_52_8]
MAQDTIRAIEDNIKEAENLPEAKKAELLKLLSTLEDEIAELSKSDAEHARSIAGFVELSAREATRRKPKPELLKLAIEGMEESVDGFEVSHPRLAHITNSICVMLSNIGI